MNKPDTTTQRAIIESALKTIEAEAYSLKIAGEAFQAIGVVAKAEEKATQLADAMKLHAFYTAKLAELPTA